jgi:nicotinamidase-related amidase
MNLLKIDLPETALVVIDLQKGIVAIPVQPHPAATVIANAAKLAEAFRQKQMPVFLVHITSSPDGKDALKPIADAPFQRSPRTLWPPGQKRNTSIPSKPPSPESAESEARNKLWLLWVHNEKRLPALFRFGAIAR